ncbi:MFS transporter [Streptomyces anatolicus]|uniref:MFS transporter n=1 Tax=Streptomyces anatolicus TaxID=2675858 RepID=UPI0027DF0C3A|nr:MFS transporter [Streptomyces anatolicus]
MSVRLLLINQFGIDFGFFLVIPYLASHLGQGLGLSAGVVGVVLGVRNVSSQCMFVLGGSATDRVGAHRVIPAGCLLGALGYALFSTIGGVPTALAASMLSGLAAALMYPAVRAYVAVAAPDRRAEAFALHNMASTTGSLGGMLLGGLLFVVDFRLCALAASGISLLLAIAQLRTLPPHRIRPARGKVLRDWSEVLGNRGFLTFAIAMVGMSAMENQVFLLLPQAAREASGWSRAAGVLPVLGTAVNVIFQMRVARYVCAHGRDTRWVSRGLALMGLSFLPPVLVAGIPEPVGARDAVLHMLPLAMGTLLLYTGVMVAQPTVMELIPLFGRETLTGTYFGLYYVFSGLAAAAGNALVGWAMDTGQQTGRPWLPWMCCTGFGLASAVATAWLHRMRALPTERATAVPAV